MKNYNGTKHRATHETPYNLYFNDAVNHQKIPVASKHPEPKFKVGDFIRLSKVKKIFEKGYTPRYTHEVFKITEIDNSAYPYMYQLEDLQGEKITGKSYEKEMILTEVPHLKIINKIEKRKTEGRTKMVLVSYIDYGSKFDELFEYKNKK